MSDDVIGYNLFAWQDFPRHDPEVPPKSEKGFHCAFRDEEGRRCGRPMNVGKMGLRHNPPLGVHHPRKELDQAISEAIAKARE